MGHHLDGVLAFIATGLTNAPIEGLNGKVRTITRRAYGFHSARSLVSFIFLLGAGLTAHIDCVVAALPACETLE